MRRVRRSYRWYLCSGLCLLLASLFALPVLSAPKTGGTLRMSLADSDVTSFDPIVPFDNMSIWTMLHMYDQLVRVGKNGTSSNPTPRTLGAPVPTARRGSCTSATA